MNWAGKQVTFFRGRLPTQLNMGRPLALTTVICGLAFVSAEVRMVGVAALSPIFDLRDLTMGVFLWGVFFDIC